MTDHEFTDQCYKVDRFEHFVIKVHHQELGLTEGCYSPEEWYFSSIANWSGYRAWQEHLAMMAHGVDAATVWRNPQRYPAFRELIGFPGNGNLCTETCQKLAADFVANLEKADAYGIVDQEWIDLYKKFLRAFDFASERGCVLSV
jgi:hypothetical protein